MSSWTGAPQKVSVSLCTYVFKCRVKCTTYTILSLIYKTNSWGLEIVFRVYFPWGQFYTFTTQTNTQPAVSFCIRVFKETQEKLICLSFCSGITEAYLSTLNSSHRVVFRLLYSLTVWQSKVVIAKGFMLTDRFNHWTAHWVCEYCQGCLHYIDELCSHVPDRWCLLPKENCTFMAVQVTLFCSTSLQPHLLLLLWGR